ncbi:MAG: insulinase family protein [Melioribacteraceae bacterium]|nr:insulinase family protein [Melioribacteraceae bacterium]
MKKLFYLILVIAFVNPVFSQLDRSKLPEPGPASEIKIANYESFELKNGLKVFVIENRKLPRVAFNLILDVDPVLEGENAGYVSAAGDLLRTGTKKRTKDQLDQEIDLLGATLTTSATSIFASGLERNKEKLMEIVSDIILNSVFKQEELDKIKKQTLSGLATAKDDPNSISQRVGRVIMNGKDHPYGELETEETVNSFTLDMCKSYYESYFRPNVAYLAIVGDINKAKAKQLVEKYLSKWEKKDVPKMTYPAPKAPVVNKVALVDRSNSVQSVVAVGYPVELKIGSDDAIKASVVNLILGGSATGRLFMNLRESKAYTYGAYSSMSPDRLIGSFTAFTQVRTSVTDSAITEIIGEMKKLRNEKVDEEELQKAKNLLSGSFVRNLESPETIARFAINTARYNLPKDYYKNYLKTLNALTADDVLATAKKYIKPNNLYLLVVGSGDEVAKNISKFSVSSKVDYYDTNGDLYDPSAKKIPAGINAESVIKKYIEAIGGRENILKVKDKITNMTGTVQGMNLTITINQKEPNKLYQVLDAGVFQQKTIFDGTKGYTEGMGQKTEFTGEQLEDMKDNSLHSMLDYDERGVKYELTGMETINGKDAYKISFTQPSGKKSTAFYSVDSGFLVRTASSVSTAQGTFNQTIDMDDYREVQGVKYPFKMNQNFGPQSIELTITSYEINTGLPDSLFEVK